MTIYKVIRQTEGAFIGHGLYETITKVVSIHMSKEKADEEAEKLKEKKDANYYVVEGELVD